MHGAELWSSWGGIQGASLPTTRSAHWLEDASGRGNGEIWVLETPLSAWHGKHQLWFQGLLNLSCQDALHCGLSA